MLLAVRRIARQQTTAAALIHSVRSEGILIQVLVGTAAARGV